MNSFIVFKQFELDVLEYFQLWKKLIFEQWFIFLEALTTTKIHIEIVSVFEESVHSFPTVHRWFLVLLVVQAVKVDLKVDDQKLQQNQLRSRRAQNKKYYQFFGMQSGFYWLIILIKAKQLTLNIDQSYKKCVKRETSTEGRIQ